MAPESVEHGVRNAATPGEALLILARAIDNLIGTVVEDDPWMIPDEETAQPRANFGAIARPAPEPDTSAIEDQITVLEHLRSETGDPEEAQAITARIELLKDDLRPADKKWLDPPQDEVRSRVEGDEVVIPAPTPEVEAARFKWAEEELFKHAWPEGLEFYEACAAYAKGGPLWLYYGNREFVRTLPINWQQRMVADVAGMSPIEAEEMGRDLLMFRGSEGPDAVLERQVVAEEYQQ